MDNYLIPLVDQGGYVQDNKGRKFPFITGSFYTGSASSLNPSASSKKYYIKAVQAVVRTVAGDTTTSLNFYARFQRQLYTILSISVLPNVAQVVVIPWSSVGIQTDPGMEITYAADVAPTYFRTNFILAEVETV